MSRRFYREVRSPHFIDTKKERKAMPCVFYSKVLNSTPDSAWRIIRDFGSLPQWFPFVRKSELRGGGPFEVGTVRSNTVADGSVIEERLVEISDRDRRVVYDVIKGDVPTKNYSATLRVHVVTADPATCYIDWSATFDADSEPDAAVAWARDEIFKVSLDELERVLLETRSINA